MCLFFVSGTSSGEEIDEELMDVDDALVDNNADDNDEALTSEDETEPNEGNEMCDYCNIIVFYAHI